MKDVLLLNDNLNNLDNIEKINYKLFKLINNGEWKEIIKIIKKNKNFDYNIKDSKNIYFLEYLILFNKYEIIKLIIKELKLDIVDENNRSILYNIIKFSYNEILKIILEENNNNIGLNINEIYDNNNNNSLMYCIQFNNIESLKILCDYVNNFNIKNNDGYNALHISIINNNFSIFKILTKYYNLNTLTNDGETPLHLSIKNNNLDFIDFLLKSNIKLNITENKYNLSPLHYIAISNDINLCLLIKKYINLFDGNIQDKNGNIFYCYFIEKITLLNKNDVLKMFNIYKQITFNYNIFNIDGNISLHLILEKLNIYKNYTDIINDVIINSDLNIQNNYGESSLFLLVKYDYWENVKDILEKKKLDIFIFNNKRETIFKYLDKNKINSFLELITKSYLYILSSTDKNYYLSNDNNCKDLIQSNKKNNCHKIILDRISDCVNIFINKNIIMNKMFSYPKTKLYPKLIDNYPEVNISSYSTTSINIFSGLLYLSKKYKNTKSSINLIKQNTELINFNNNYSEFINYSLYWKNYKFINDINSLYSYINQIKDKTNFFIIPLGIELFDSKGYKGHSNYLIFDFKNNRLERFEPYGSEPPQSMNYDSNLLDNVLENFSLQFNLEYLPPKKYLPKISFQYKEIYELKSNYIGDPDGFCSTWSTFWTELRLKHPSIDIYKLEVILNKEIINNNISYRNLIRNYSKNITDIRDNFLEKINSNINDWNNDKITKDNILKLEELIKKSLI